MSKTQDKKAARIAEAKAFVQARRQAQIAIFESNFNAGVQFFMDNKEKMSPEEIALIEAEIEKNQKLIDEWKENWGVEE